MAINEFDNFLNKIQDYLEKANKELSSFDAHLKKKGKGNNCELSKAKEHIKEAQDWVLNLRTQLSQKQDTGDQKLYKQIQSDQAKKKQILDRKSRTD